MTYVGNSLIGGVRVGGSAVQRMYVGDEMAWQPYTGDGSMLMVEFTGNGATNRTQTGLPFTPGLLLWINNGGPGTYGRYWIDLWGSPQPRYWAVGGLNPLTYGWGGITADGWKSTSNSFNSSGRPFQVFVWPKGDAVQTVNNDGTLEASIFVNDQAGWSSGAYGGNGAADQTFGHGLSAAPSMVLIWGGTDPYTNPRIRITGQTYRAGSWSEPGGQSSSPGIITTDENVITVSNIDAVNKLGAINQFIAFRDVPGKVATGTVNGNGVATEVVTGLGFEPTLVFLMGIDGTTENEGLYAYTKRTGQTVPYYANYRTMTAYYSTPDPQPISTKFSMLADGFQIEAVNRGNNGTSAAHWIAFA